MPLLALLVFASRRMCTLFLELIDPQVEGLSAKYESDLAVVRSDLSATVDNLLRDGVQDTNGATDRGFREIQWRVPARETLWKPVAIPPTFAGTIWGYQGSVLRAPLEIVLASKHHQDGDAAHPEHVQQDEGPALDMLAAEVRCQGAEHDRHHRPNGNTKMTPRYRQADDAG